MMCDSDDSVFTWGRLQRHLGSGSDGGRPTRSTNELDGEKEEKTTFFFESEDKQ